MNFHDTSKKLPVWPFLAFCLLGGVFLVAAPLAGGAARVIVGYPIMAVLPGFFLYGTMEKNGRKLRDGLLFGMALGPVIAALVGVLALYAGIGATGAGRVILLFSAVLGTAALVRNRKWPVARPQSGWLAAAIISAIVLLLVIVPLLQDIRVRLSYHGWYHASLAYKIILSGVPPEDPMYPGGTVHNYWFFHAWVALLTAILRRPPSDIISIINVHSLVAVIAAVWAMATRLKGRWSATLALLFTLLGMNALGFIFLPIKMWMFNAYPIHVDRPLALLQYMCIWGDKRLAHFLTKYLHSNAFPLGIALFAFCLWAYFRVFSKGANFLLLFSIFLAVLGALLFHPTSGLGLCVGIAGGIAAVMLLNHKNNRRAALLSLGTAVLGGLVTLPYLFSIFPSNAGGIVVRPLASNIFGTFICYIVLLPFILNGARHLIREGERWAVFLVGFSVGIVVISIMLVLPGLNQYKFIRLLALPAGLFGAAAFLDRRASKLKKALLAFIMVAALANTAILEYAFLASDWSKDNTYSSKGIDIIPAKDYFAEAAFYRWIRTNTPIDSALMGKGRIHRQLPLSQRSMITPLWTWVSLGQPQAKARRKIVRRLLSPAQFRPADIRALKRLNRPLYIMLTPYDRDYRRVQAKFDRLPDLFNPVYKSEGARLYWVRKD